MNLLEAIYGCHEAIRRRNDRRKLNRLANHYGLEPWQTELIIQASRDNCAALSNEIGYGDDLEKMAAIAATLTPEDWEHICETAENLT